MSADSVGPGPAAMRPALTRDRIVEAAIALVDEAGPDALTMRAVAQRLGAGTMSLYRHVAGREELLDLVLQAMDREIPVRPLTGDWRADLAAIARDMRTSLIRRPQLTVLMASRTGRGGAELPRLDRTLGVLRSAGFGRRGAVMANQALGSYVTGVALREAMTPPEAAALPAERFPSLAWVGPKLAAGSVDDRFEFGLTTLLDGFAAYLARRNG